MKQLEAFGIKKVFIRKDPTSYNRVTNTPKGEVSTPYVGNVEKQTMQNKDYRNTLFTGKHSQLVLMNIKPRQSIGNEVHPKVDQFFRIESGQAEFTLNNKQKITEGPGGAVLVPGGHYHNVTNPSKTRDLKLYTIYSPSNHPPGTRQKTRPRGD